MEKRKEVVNYLKTVNFGYPEWIPATVGILPATWMKYGEELEKLLLDHPTIFPHYNKGYFKKMRLSPEYKTGTWVDVWGITWDNKEEGMCGAPLEANAPLRNWADFQSYRVPDPVRYNRYGNAVDWERLRKDMEETKSAGGLAAGGFFHGAMYMQLYYLRGFNNFMIDVAMREPKLQELIRTVLEYNITLIKKWIETGAEFMHFGDDLGLQKNLPISPADWRYYLKPCFCRIYRTCREKDVYTYQHTDGYILDIIPDLIECGLHILNPQVRPNTLNGIARNCKGKICVALDLDRQMFPFATTDQIREHIKETVDTLAMPEGGLMLVAECAPDVTLDRIEAICKAMEDLNCRGI